MFVVELILRLVGDQNKVTVMESDNCKSHYKSVNHLFNIQTINSFDKKSYVFLG